MGTMAKSHQRMFSLQDHLLKSWIKVTAKKEQCSSLLIKLKMSLITGLREGKEGVMKKLQ